MELSHEKMQVLGQQALELALAIYEGAGERAIFPVQAASPNFAADLRATLDEPLPFAAMAGESVLATFARDILPACRNNGHPRMNGYIVSNGTWIGALGDLLAAACNQNVTAWRSSPGATEIEQLVIRWVTQLLGFPEQMRGILTSGGSMANFIALTSALRAKAGVEVNAVGLSHLGTSFVFYTSNKAHLSMAKSLSLLGVGTQALRMLATDHQGKLALPALAAAVAEDRQRGAVPVAVIAHAGDVSTGVIDPMHEIADFCRDQQMWMHVDAAYGGFAATSSMVRRALSGIERADSIALDAHKWLYVPLDAGCVLVRHEASLRAAFASQADYIAIHRGDDPQAVRPEHFAFWDFGPELSRRFRALKIWMTFKTYGVDALGAAVEANLAAALVLQAALSAAPDFEVLAPAGLSIVCFRHVPLSLRTRIDHAGEAEASDLESELDQHNRRLWQAVVHSGRAYLSNATIAGRFALRACVVNHRATSADLLQLLPILRELAPSNRA